MFGGDGHFMGAIEIGGATGADDFNRNSGPLTEIDGLGKPRVGLRDRVLRRIGHKALEGESGGSVDRLRESEGLGRCGCAATQRAGIALDQNRQREAGAGHRGGKPLNRLARIRHHLDVGAMSERHEAVELNLAYEVVSKQNVGNSGVRHHLDLAEFLAIHALRAEPDLEMGELGDLVSLDVRTQAEAVPVEVGLAAPEVVLHHVEVNDRAGRVEVLHKHWMSSFRPLVLPVVLTATGRGPTAVTCRGSGSPV